MIDLVLSALLLFHFDCRKLQSENGTGYGISVWRRYGEQTRSINLDFYSLKHFEYYYEIEQPYHDSNSSK